MPHVDIELEDNKQFISNIPRIFFFLCNEMDNVNPFKDLSGTPAPRILKFGTNIGYDHLYRVRKNQHPHIYHSLYLSIFFL